MKLLKSKLQQIIKEEIEKIIEEKDMVPGGIPRANLPDGCWQKVGPPPQNWTRCKGEATSKTPLEKPEPKYTGGKDNDGEPIYTQAEWDEYSKKLPERERKRRGYSAFDDPEKWASLQVKKKWLALPPEERMPIFGSGTGFGGLDDREKVVLKKHQEMQDDGYVLVDPYKLIYQKEAKIKRYDDSGEEIAPYIFKRNLWIDAGDWEPNDEFDMHIARLPDRWQKTFRWGDPNVLTK